MKRENQLQNRIREPRHGELNVKNNMEAYSIYCSRNQELPLLKTEEAPGIEFNTEESWEQIQEKRLLKDAIEKLPHHIRHIILSITAGESIADISQRMERPPEYVRYRIQTAVRMMRYWILY